MYRVFAPHFRKPKGIIGYWVSNRMIKSNFYVYPAIEQHAGFQEKMDVLEIGYGPGIGLSYFLGKYGIRMEGIDFSKLMFWRASRKNRKFIRNGRLKLFHGDVLEFEPAGIFYDRVVFANVSYFISELVPFFGRIRRLLKPKGKLVFYMSNKSRLERNPLTRSDVFHRHDLQDIVRSIVQCGYQDVLAHPVMDGSGDYLVIEAMN